MVDFIGLKVTFQLKQHLIITNQAENTVINNKFVCVTVDMVIKIET